jgi:hypothetical protein
LSEDGVEAVVELLEIKVIGGPNEQLEVMRARADRGQNLRTRNVCTRFVWSLLLIFFKSHRFV